MEVRIRAPKADKTAAIIILAATIFAHFYSLYISDEGEMLLIFLGAFCVVYAFGMEIYCTEYGVEKKFFGKTLRSFEWNECIFVGLYIPVGSRPGAKTFVCAKTPLRHKSVMIAKWNRWWGNPDGPDESVYAAWKRREEISVSYHWVGDENYRKILELCGGERNVRETDLD